MNIQAIIASRHHSAKLEDLRRVSYHNSAGFRITNEQEFEAYCRWGKKDESGMVLAVLDAQGEMVSSLRANVYFSATEHETNNPGFAGQTEDFIIYPTLDMTFAATAPLYFKNGFLSVLRYYMYLLHRHTVKSIAGQVVKGSTSYFTLQKLQYDFKEIDRTRPDSEAVNKWTLANLDAGKFDKAIEMLRTKYTDRIQQIPLLISS